MIILSKIKKVTADNVLASLFFLLFLVRLLQKNIRHYMNKFGIQLKKLRHILGCIFSRLFFLIELNIFLVIDINDKLSFPKFRENQSVSWIATLPSKFCNGHMKSKFQNYCIIGVDSLKRSSRRVEMENIQH